MKRTLALIALMTAFFACKKQGEEPNTNTGDPDGKQKITATVTAPTAKAAFEDGANGLSSKWETGDHFYAYQITGEEVSIVTFTLTSGEGTTTGKFQTETTGVTEETTWTAVFGSSANVSGEEIQCSYKNQTGTLAAIDDFNYATASGTGKEPSFNFDKDTCLTYVMKIKLPADIKCIEYTPCAYWSITPGEKPAKKYYVKTPTFEDSADSSAIYAAWLPENTSTITLATPSTKGQAVFIAVPAIKYAYDADANPDDTQYKNMKTGVIVTMLNNVSDNATKSEGFVLDENKVNTRIGTYDMSEVTLLDRPTKSQAVIFSKTTSESDTGFEVAYSAQTMWAPFNLGASSGTAVGTYYAWGETQPKTEYSEDKYLYAHDYAEAGTLTYDVIPTVALGDGVKGEENYKKLYFTICGSRYDVARVKWGKDWRMPGFLEGWALNSFTTTGSASGITIDNGTGGSLSFPAAGAIKGTEAGHIDNSKTYRDICVWTGDTFRRKYEGSNSVINAAYVIGENKSSYNKGLDWWRSSQYRWWGLNVRPVHAESTVTVNSITLK